MHDQQILPDATNLITHLRIGNVRGDSKSDLENALLQHLESLSIRVLVFSRQGLCIRRSATSRPVEGLGFRV
jgi:hypothetical protein